MITKAELQSAVNTLQTDRDAHALALQDSLSDNVKWFGRGHKKLGISRECSASGGIVITVTACYTSAYYWESWFESVRHSEVSDLRDLAFEAHNWILNRQEEFFNLAKQGSENYGAGKPV